MRKNGMVVDLLDDKTKNEKVHKDMQFFTTKFLQAVFGILLRFCVFLRISSIMRKINLNFFNLNANFMKVCRI